MTTPAQEHEAQAIATVENLAQILVKGMRAIQLYLPNNPVYQRAIQNIQSAFGEVWEETFDLVLAVSESSLTWDGREVLAQESKSDSLAWILFKDGVRSVTFQKGVEDEEIVRFLAAIHRARTLDAEASDDLLTLLWDEDFQYIKYDYVELGMDEVTPLAPSDEKPEVTEDDVRQQVQEEVQEEAAPTVISIDDFDSTMYFLDENEISYLNDEIEREYKQDLRSNVLSMVFDLLELQTYSTVRAELLSILDNFIPYLLAVGDFHAVAYILREIRVVMERARELLPEHVETLTALPARLSDSEALGQLLQSLDEAAVHPTEEELGELFRELHPEALSTLLAWFPRLTNERVRSLLYAAAKRLAQAYPEELVKALEATDEQVLVQTTKLAGQLQLPPVVPGLGKLLEYDRVAVRREAVDALAKTGTPGAMQQLEKAIEDADRDVRIAAVRVLGRKQHPGALAPVQIAVEGKGLRDADLTEKTAFFEAYGLLAGPKGMAKLEGLLQPRGLLRRKEDPQIRACAAMALGKIGTPEARAALSRSVGDKDPLVRNAVNRALEGETHP